MTIKTLTGYLAAGYTLKATYDGIDVAAGGGVGGSGLTLAGYGFVENKGVLRGAGVNAADNYNDGVRLSKGGDVTNETAGAYIGGTTGVYIVGNGALNNFGLIRGTRLTSPGALITGSGEVDNHGTIVGLGEGVTVEGGGTLRNGDSDNLTALVEGGGGVDLFGGVGNLTNYGTILGSSIGDGADVGGGGTITNGSFADTTALISGDNGVQTDGAASTISNFGTILGLVQTGVEVIGGGLVINGSVTDTVALVSGVGGILIASATGMVRNFGTVRSSNAIGTSGGVQLNLGGAVTNGAANDPAALIVGYSGVYILGAAGVVSNFGTIIGMGGSTQSGVGSTYGGTVTNGALGDATASITGATGVSLGKAGKVVNFGRIAGSLNSGVDIVGVGTVNNQGTITGAFAYGVNLEAGGSLINGGGANRSALIEGNFGVDIQGGAGTVANFGTILAQGVYAFGVYLRGGGTLTNGSVNNTTALIEGEVGLQMQAGDTAVNFGTLWGTGDTGGSGAYLLGGSLTNGAAGKTGAVVEGYDGIVAGTAATVTNFGTISGASGVAVSFVGAGDTLVAEAGSVFQGSVLGGNGTLILGSGTGTIAGTLASKAVTVAGSMAATTFDNFKKLEVAAGATFTMAGAEALAAGQSLFDLGALTISGAVTNASVIETSGKSAVLSLKGAVANTGTLYAAGGVLSVTGAVTGTGSARISVGTLDLGSTFTQNVTFAGTTGVLELAKSATYTGTITGFSKTATTSLDLLDIAFVAGTKATYSGTATSGTLTVTDGTHTAHLKFSGNYLTSTWVVSTDSHGGTKVVDPMKPGSGPVPDHPLIGAIAGFAPSTGADSGRTTTQWCALPPMRLATHTA
jgi:hypothetical protein